MTKCLVSYSTVQLCETNSNVAVTVTFWYMHCWHFHVVSFSVINQSSKSYYSRSITNCNISKKEIKFFNVMATDRVRLIFAPHKCIWRSWDNVSLKLSDGVRRLKVVFNDQAEGLCQWSHVNMWNRIVCNYIKTVVIKSYKLKLRSIYWNRKNCYHYQIRRDTVWRKCEKLIHVKSEKHGRYKGTITVNNTQYSIMSCTQWVAV